MKQILFVCTGNTCRSPLAEHLLRHLAGERFEVKSAGLAAFPGQEAAQHVQALLDERGIPVDHRSQPVTPELMAWADLVLTMTDAHRTHLQEIYPEKKEQIHTLRRYVNPQDEVTDISDPFGGSREVYEATLKEIESLLVQLIEKEQKSETEEGREKGPSQSGE